MDPWIENDATRCEKKRIYLRVWYGGSAYYPNLRAAQTPPSPSPLTYSPLHPALCAHTACSFLSSPFRGPTRRRRMLVSGQGQCTGSKVRVKQLTGGGCSMAAQGDECSGVDRACRSAPRRLGRGRVGISSGWVRVANTVRGWGESESSGGRRATMRYCGTVRYREGRAATCGTRRAALCARGATVRYRARRRATHGARRCARHPRTRYAGVRQWRHPGTVDHIVRPFSCMRKNTGGRQTDGGGNHTPVGQECAAPRVSGRQRHLHASQSDERVQQVPTDRE